MESKASKWYKLITNQAYLKSVQSYLFNWVSDREKIYHKKLNILRLFNNLNSFHNSDTFANDIAKTIKDIVIDDLSDSFIAICTMNEELNAIKVNLIKANNRSIEYIIPLESAEKELINIFKSNKNHNIRKKPDQLLNYKLDTNIKQVIGIPINSYNNKSFVICIGIGNESKTTESLIINAIDLNNHNERYKTNPIVHSNKQRAINANLANKFINNVYNNRYNEPTHHETFSSLPSIIDNKDQYIREHSYAVSKYAEMICEELGLSKQENENISLGALLHDIGKIEIPEKVLCKPSKLNDQEWRIIKQHPTIGARKIIQPISALNDLIPVIEHHHERWDGKGYPHGLRENEIPLGARVVSIVDAFHTMTTDRRYRKSLGYNNAVEILKKGSGSQWDSSLVQSFINISEKAYNTIQN